MHPLLQPVLNNVSVGILAITTLIISLPVISSIPIYKRLWHYFIQSQLEKKARKLSNGGKITIGKVHLNIFLGVFECRDVVVHTRSRDLWKWRSPLVVRVGYVKVKFHVLSCCDIKYWLGYMCKDVYSIFVSDVQVFVETRQMEGPAKKDGTEGDVCTIYNFNLFDESLDIDFFERKLGQQESHRIFAAGGSFNGISRKNEKLREDSSESSDSEEDTDSDSNLGVCVQKSKIAASNANLLAPNSDRRHLMGKSSQMSIRAEKKATNLVSTILNSVGRITASPNTANLKSEGKLLMTTTKDLLENQSLEEVVKVGEVSSRGAVR